MTKHRSSDRDTSVVISLHWTRTVSREKPYRTSLSAPAPSIRKKPRACPGGRAGMK